MNFLRKQKKLSRRGDPFNRKNSRSFKINITGSPTLQTKNKGGSAGHDKDCEAKLIQGRYREKRWEKKSSLGQNVTSNIPARMGTQPTQFRARGWDPR